MSNHHWGESPTGRWILRIETRKPQPSTSKSSESTSIDVNELSYFGLHIYGTSDPNKINSAELKKRVQTTAYVPTKREIEATYKDELEKRATPNIMGKRDYEKQKKNVHQEDRSFLGIFRRVFAFK